MFQIPYPLSKEKKRNIHRRTTTNGPITTALSLPLFHFRRTDNTCYKVYIIQLTFYYGLLSYRIGKNWFGTCSIVKICNCHATKLKTTNTTNYDYGKWNFFWNFRLTVILTCYNIKIIIHHPMLHMHNLRSTILHNKWIYMLKLKM